MLFTTTQRRLNQALLRDAQQKHERQWTQVRAWEILTQERKKAYSQWGQLVLEQGLEEGCATSTLGDIWKPNHTKPWATCRDWPYNEPEVRLHALHKSLPTYMILWFYGANLAHWKIATQLTGLIENIPIQWESSSCKPLYKKILKKAVLIKLGYVKILNMNQLNDGFTVVCYVLFF